MMKRSFIEHAVRGGLLASILAAAGCSGRVNIGDDSRGLGDEVSGSGGFDSTADGGPLGHSGGSAGRSGDSDASLSAKCADPPSSVLL